MKLFYSKGACSLVVRIIINELGLKAQFEAVDLKDKKTETGQDFYAINPKGSVPLLQTDDGQFLSENAAILQYLADNTRNAASDHLLPEVGSFQRYRVLEWLNYVTTELHKSYGVLFSQAIPEQDKKEIFIPLLISKFKFVNQHLEKSAYLCGEEYSLADAYLFVMLMWSAHFKIDLNEYSALKKYFEKLKQRKPIQQSLQDEGIPC